MIFITDKDIPMKTLLFILIIVICNFAQFREGSGPVPDFTYDTTRFILQKFELNMNQEFSMKQLMYQEQISFDQKNEIAYVKDAYWKSLSYRGKDMIATFMAAMCGNANKNYKYPLTIKSWETKQTLGTHIVSQRDLGRKRKQVSPPTPSGPTYEKILIGSDDSLFFQRLQRDKRIYVVYSKIVIKSDLWDAWDDQLKDDMLFTIAVAWGNKAKDYSYNPEITILPDIKHSSEKIAQNKLKVFTKSFKRPATKKEADSLKECMGRRYWRTYRRDKNVEDLLEGEKDRVSYYIEEDLLYVNHSIRTAYIQKDVWEKFSTKEKKVMTTLIAVKCGNEIRNYDYKITIKDMENHNKTYASYNHRNYSLASNF